MYTWIIDLELDYSCKLKAATSATNPLPENIILLILSSNKPNPDKYQFILYWRL